MGRGGLEADQLRSKRIIGLFMSAALLLSSGCGDSAKNHRHVDEDQDGYCDYDNEPMNQGSRSGGAYYYGGNAVRGSGVNNAPADGAGRAVISQGAKGGIGSGSSGAAG